MPHASRIYRTALFFVAAFLVSTMIESFTIEPFSTQAFPAKAFAALLPKVARPVAQNQRRPNIEKQNGTKQEDNGKTAAATKDHKSAAAPVPAPRTPRRQRGEVRRKLPSEYVLTLI